MASMPVADLTYRGYDGPLLPPTHRWWVIAWMLIRRNLKRPWLWVATAFSSFYYVIMIITITLTKQQADSMTPPIGTRMQVPNMFEELMKRIVWKDQFLHALSFGQFMFLILVLMIGVGSIANENRANALLVYLSKPCSKKDYILGKWLGIFILLFSLMALPSILFYLYGIASFREWGFFTEDRLMLLKVLGAITLQAGFLTSLAVGISSMFNQGRLAGIVMFGLYFMTNFFTKVMEMLYKFGGDEDQVKGMLPLIKNLYYASIDGVNIGITKVFLGTNGTLPFAAFSGRGSGMQSVPRPEWFVVIVPMIAVSALAIYIAWKRVRAVEVVG